MLLSIVPGVLSTRNVSVEVQRDNYLIYSAQLFIIRARFLLV